MTTLTLCLVFWLGPWLCTDAWWGWGCHLELDERKEWVALLSSMFISCTTTKDTPPWLDTVIMRGPATTEQVLLLQKSRLRQTLFFFFSGAVQKSFIHMSKILWNIYAKWSFTGKQKMLTDLLLFRSLINFVFQKPSAQCCFIIIIIIIIFYFTI